MLRRFIGCCCALVLIVGAGACGSDDNEASDDDQSAAATTVPEGSSLPGDACALLSANDVGAVLGTPVAGTVADRVGSDGEAGIKGCIWGELADDAGLLAVQVSAPDPDTGIDALEAVVRGAGGGGTPVDIGDDGQLVPRAHVPNGGGAGLSVMFGNNGNTVVVGATKASEEQIKAAAQTVLANLDS